MTADEDLLLDLQKLVQRLNALPDMRDARPTPLGEAVAAFLGADPAGMPVISDTVGPHRLVDVDLALESLSAEDDGARLIGVAGGQERNHEELQGLLQHRYSTFSPGSVEYTVVATGPDSTRQVVAFGIRLFRWAGDAVAVLVRAAAPMHGRNAAMIEVLAPSAETGTSLLAELRRRMNALSVIRGQVVSFTPDEFGHGFGGVTFLHRPGVAAADVVLPEGVLARVTGHVVDIGTHADTLRGQGQHLKRGVLLYGPPGTGKTLTVQHLLAATPGRTAILLQGGSLRFVAEAARLARAMAPAMLVFEDIDLIALERSMSGGPQPLLFEILDALDGVGGDADITFLMTTNRADLLEPALAARPGRVDLAVEIPLPGASERRALFRLYGADAPFSTSELDAAADRAEGVTASFAKELVRRALLRAVLAGREADDQDLREALREMQDSRAQLTRTLLGSDPAGAPDAHDPAGGASTGWFAYQPFAGETYDEGDPA